jgi:hypothetical protein
LTIVKSSFAPFARWTVALGAAVLGAAGIAAAVPDHTTAWIQQFGGSAVGMDDYSNDIAVSADGSTLTAGGFTQTMTVGATTLTPVGGQDPYVIKTNPDGTNAWAVSAGGAGSASAWQISGFPDGSAVVTGTFSGTKTFGAYSITSAGGADVFVAKISAAGTWQWASRAGDATDQNVVDIVALADGSSAITGIYKSAWSIGGTNLPWVGTYVPNNRDYIGYVAKLDASGAWTWANHIASSNTALPKGIAAASDGSVYVAGTYRGLTATFGAYPLSSGRDQSLFEGFVGKLNASGAWQWATSTTTTDATDPGQWMQGTSAEAITVADNGDPIVGGYFNGRLTAGATTIDAAGTGSGYNFDGWIARLSASAGSWQWASRAGGTGRDYFTSLAARGDGKLVATGITSTAVTIGSSSLGSGTAGLVAVIGGDGAWDSARATGLGEIRGMGLDSCGSPYIAGWMRGTLTYTVTSPSTVLTTTPANRWDGYLAKVSVPTCIGAPAVVAASAPTSLVATAHDQSVEVAFSPGANGGSPISNYQYRLNGSGSWTAFSPAQTTSPVTISGLTNGTSYTVELRAITGYASPGATSSASNAATPIGATPAPADPTPPAAGDPAPRETPPATPAPIAEQGTAYVPPVPVPASGIGKGDVPNSVVVAANTPVTAREVARTAKISTTGAAKVVFAVSQSKGLTVRSGMLVATVPGLYTVTVVLRTRSGKSVVRKVKMYVGQR